MLSFMKSMHLRGNEDDKIQPSSMLDRLSEKLSINSEFSPPSTPTPSLFQSVAARAIPCVDIKVRVVHGINKITNYLTFKKKPLTATLAYETSINQQINIQYQKLQFHVDRGVVYHESSQEITHLI